VVTTSRYPETNAAVYVLSSTTGALVGNLNVTGVKTDINFPLNKIEVASDGAIYACSLAVDSAVTAAAGNNGPFRIYRWANESAAPVLAYEGDPSANDATPANRRFGDSMAVRGSGVNTEILFGTRAGTIVVLFKTTDGINFTPTIISAPELFTGTTVAMQSIAWGAGDTFYTKADIAAIEGQFPLQHFSLDANSATATLIDSQMNLAARLGGPFGFDAERGLLAIIKAHMVGEYPTHQLRLFKATELGLEPQDVPVPFRSFGTKNTNGNGVGAIDFGGGMLFALDSNNGIMAFKVKEAPIQTQIFWAEDGGFGGPELGSVWRVNADGTGKEAIATGLNRPVGVAVDPVNRYLYWAEDGFQDVTHPSRIVRARFDGSERTVLFNQADHGFSNAQMLQLDVANGHIYWTTYFAGVMRGNLDGTGYTELGGAPGAVQFTAIDLDLANGHIYFNDPTQMGVLFRMELNGANPVELARDISTIDSWHFNTIALDVANNNIYYADAGTHEIKRMDLDGTNPTLILTDAGAIPFGVARCPDNTLCWVARAQRLATAKLDGSEHTPSIAEIGATPFGIAVYSAPTAPITGISIAESVVTITWDGGVGPFQVQRRASLTTGEWENLGARITSREITDTVGSGQMFYRIAE
jgi:sugar lactone lactonase YvrE